MRMFNKKALLDNPGKTEIQIFRKKFLDYLFKSFTQIEWGEKEYRLNGIVVLRLEDRSGKIRARFFQPATKNKSNENGHFCVGTTPWIKPGDDATKIVMVSRDHLVQVENQFIGDDEEENAVGEVL